VKHPARWIALAVAAVVVVFGVVLAVNVGNDPQADAQRSPFLGKQVPTFDLPTLTGGRVSNASINGKSVIINFWNTWCIPCQQELPQLKEFAAQHASDDDVVMVGIVRDEHDSTQKVRAYVKSQGITWTIALDPGSQAALDFATRGQPETIAVSPSGVVAASQYGPMTTANLERFLAAARAYG
jgi:cytochrome c biogenesis protein CcmG, thiol:disulfide interchange protein DsbE